MHAEATRARAANNRTWHFAEQGANGFGATLAGHGDVELILGSITKERPTK